MIEFSSDTYWLPNKLNGVVCLIPLKTQNSIRPDQSERKFSVKDSLLNGLTIKRKIEINRERTISFMGDEGRVYSTPSMVEDIEYTCHELIQCHLDESENTVGIHVFVDHVGATLEGDTVEVTATVIDVEGRTISMEATVTDSLEEVGRGKHRRFVVDVKKTFDRLQEKR